MNLSHIQSFLQDNALDGWLLYNFRDLNPIAQAVTGLAYGGTRRWFLWIPARGSPSWLIHAIEGHMFADATPELQGKQHRYVSWQEMAAGIPRLVGVEDLVHDVGDGSKPFRIAMEYSRNNALPFISRVDAGIKELVEEALQPVAGEIVSSADLAQIALAVLSPAQLNSHRRAVEVCLATKDAAFALIGERVGRGEPISEYDVQQFISDRFVAAGMEATRPIVAVNAHAADPHYAPTKDHHSPIQRGDMVLIDLWTRLHKNAGDCFADSTWTAYCGEAVPIRVQQVFAVVQAARDRAVSFIQQRLDAGQMVYGHEVDDATRSVIDDAGYGPHFIHRTGHSLGPTEHYLGVNLDNLETQDQRALLPGIMFTVEPGIYMPDFNYDDSPLPKGLGIRSEINCYMHADRVEVTTLPVQTEVLALLG